MPHVVQLRPSRVAISTKALWVPRGGEGPRYDGGLDQGPVTGGVGTGIAKLIVSVRLLND